MWDKINGAYANRKQPLMYGLATDDSHSYHQFGSAFSNAGRGWVMVQAKSLDAASVIEAMEAGRFYASTGVTFSNFSFRNNQLQIEIEEEAGVAYTIEVIGLKAGADEMEVVETQQGTYLDFEVTKEYVFVRVRVTSNKQKENPFQEGDWEMAWTQPVSVK
jgi:hypothetical protein